MGKGNFGFRYENAQVVGYKGDSVPYTFYSAWVGKVQDAAGVVHETRSPDGDRAYARVTKCQRHNWAAVEPITTLDDDRVLTTCLECLST